MQAHERLDSLGTEKTLTVDGQDYQYFSLSQAEKEGLGDLSKLPFSLKILLENLLRYEDGRSVYLDDVKAIGEWLKQGKVQREIAYRPTRVLMQDFTGVPAVVDLAAMREAMVHLGEDAQKINPLSNVDLVIDHSVMVDKFGNSFAFKENVLMEFKRNFERYSFLRWGQQAFSNFRVVPPGTGICHQVNLEYLGQTVWTSNCDGKAYAYPDTLVGTDSHTTMINGLAILGWGVGGIEAEAAMLGQPISMLIPEVIGFKLTGRLSEGTTATDLVLTVTQMLREKGVVGKFVEFYGDGLDTMTLADRATISNMAPEYGATCGLFPIDDETLNYLRFTGRDEHRIKLVEAYAKEQGMWRNPGEERVFTDTLELDMSTVEPSLAGPKRPQDKVFLRQMKSSIQDIFKETGDKEDTTSSVEGQDYELTNGDVMIAAITSCTNTSNPAVMIGAGLVAKKAIEKGLSVKPWVKTSLAPGSQVVTDYLEKSNLQESLDQLGFNLVGYGCTTCIGNSGPLSDDISKAIESKNLTVGAVLSGNRNFEGRIHALTKLNYLASPPLVVAYALAGNLLIDLVNDPIGQNDQGEDVYLKDIWPTNKEIQETMETVLSPEMFKTRYSNVFEGDDEWKDIKTTSSMTYNWNDDSTYVKHPPFFENMSSQPNLVSDITGARPLAILGDSVTTDHISPAGAIKKDSPAGSYLVSNDVSVIDFNSYGSRRGNHEVMMRGTFANIRIRNEMVGGKEGGWTKYMPSGEEMSIYDAAMKYVQEGTPLVVVAGKEYGTGSSRDWAAKGTRLLGVKAVIAESFERIHRSNLVGMGVLPLQFTGSDTRKSLNLDGSETITIEGLSKGLDPRMTLDCKITKQDGSETTIQLLCRIDTLNEVDYYRHGGILHYVLRSLAGVAA